jgi:transcriptional regulator with XRE-family HTH domain
MRTAKNHLNDKLKDVYFKELYELEKQKLKIVKKIIAYRIKHRLTQKGFAKKVGVTQQHISKIERGEFSSIKTLEKILLFTGNTIRIQVIDLSRKIPAKMIEELVR